MEKHLNIFFPEWQGYGEDNTVQQGAQRLKEHLSTFTFVEIAIAEEEELPVSHNILGYESNLKHLQQAVELLKSEAPATTFMVGGTCASEIAPVSYLNKYYEGDLAVLWFDAHGDLNSPVSSPSKHFHGMPLRSLLGDGTQRVSDLMFSQLNPDQVFVLGGRDLDQPERDFVKEAGLSVWSPGQLTDEKKLIEMITASGYNNVYIHIDLDVLEPSDFPHMLLPIDHGL
ncbi:MAG: arginase family protein, partial [Bacteroidota bacterium]